MNDIIIGIDLGTSNSEVSVVKQGKVTVIADGHHKILPSYVGINDHGDIIVGEIAKNQYLLYPDRTVKSIKRLMGGNTSVKLAEQDFSAQEISAIILKHLKAVAENYLGQSVSKAVITVPAYFSDTQRQATYEAGKIAGLDVVRMINEPTAAALTYDANQAEKKHLLVYDLGGGTFDVSVVNIEAGVVEVLSSHGDNHLGGDDFDQKIIQYLLDHIQATYAVDARQYSKAMARITRAAEQAKFVLSDQPYAQIDEEYLLEHNGVAIHLSIELSRMQYEEMIEDYINLTMDAVHTALTGAKIKASDIDEVILVGGSTRTPCVRERLLNEFGFEPHGEVDADLCVTMGAAIQAAMINGQQVDKVLVDVTPYTYGTSAIGVLNGEPYPFTYEPIIHKNSVLPSRKTEAFVTHQHGQEFVDITIYQGEDFDALNNVKIAEFRVEGLLDIEAGNTIVLTLELDLNGILHVSAVEKATGLSKSITVNNALSQAESGSVKVATQRISALFGKLDSSLYEQNKLNSDEDQAIHPEVELAQAAISNAEKLFDDISNEDKEDILDLIKLLRECIDEQDITGLEKPATELNDIIYYLQS